MMRLTLVVITMRDAAGSSNQPYHFPDIGNRQLEDIEVGQSVPTPPLS
jgi:hypothetical protein